MYKIEYSDEAEQDLIDISIFIGEFYYKRILTLLKNTISLLSDFPEMGFKVGKQEREIIEPKYKYQNLYFSNI